MEDVNILMIGTIFSYFIWIIGTILLSLFSLKYNLYLAIFIFFISIFGILGICELANYWELNMRNSSE